VSIPKSVRKVPAKWLFKSLHSPAHDRFIKLMRQARRNAGLSQEDAAKLLRTRQNLISDIERGQRRVDVVEFVKICRAYGIKPESILNRL
jgi:transcriptional regulator with XRE-family HTH domain